MEKNYKLILRYDGTGYSGWQIQKSAKTVQGELTKTLEIITKNVIDVTGVSRTDAGVHALEYVCNVRLDTDLSEFELFRSINGILDKDIRLTSVSVCDDSFNARFDSLAKTYVYTIDNTYWGDPFLVKTAWHWGKTLDFESMQKASSFFVGTYDFSSFMSAGSSAKDFVRTVYDLSLTKEENIIKMEITGNGFLYNMVRIIAGTLVCVGVGKILPEEIPEIIERKDRNHRGITAPPQGLALKKVYYSREEINCLLKSRQSLKEY